MSNKPSILHIILKVLKSWKYPLLWGSFVLFLASYGFIYFFVDEEFESSGIVIASGETSGGLYSGLMKNLKDIPLNLGSKSKTADTDLFLTLIHSRKICEELLKKFNLQQDYKEKSWDKAIKKLKSQIKADLDDQNALIISARAKSPEKAASIVNYIIDYINSHSNLISSSKNRSNRVFLEKRYAEISNSLKNAEDSLEILQRTSGLIDPAQLKLILSSNLKLETDQMAKKVELELLQQSLPPDSPIREVINKQMQVIRDEINRFKTENDKNTTMLNTASLPKKTKEYLRLYRNIEIYSSLLAVILPLYEQAKLDEEKSTPAITIIDYGNIPEKRIFPQRTLLSAVITIFTLTSILLIISGYHYLKSNRESF